MRTKACIHTLVGHTNTIATVKCQGAEPQVSQRSLIEWMDDGDIFGNLHV